MRNLYEISWSNPVSNIKCIELTVSICTFMQIYMYCSFKSSRGFSWLISDFIQVHMIYAMLSFVWLSFVWQWIETC